MMPTLLNNSHILLGVTGGIAAYKSAELVRQLQRLGADVRVVMTRSAQSFVGCQTFQALSRHPVYTDQSDDMAHISLARWADLIIIAPASANCMAKLAHGLADDLLSTTCLATKSPIVLAPAMNQGMWLNPMTQANKNQLESRGIIIWGPAEGEQACQDIGPGRMLEAETIAQNVVDYFLCNSGRPPALAGVHLMITAGPTQEPVDPVRYISNCSSGKMGYALAEAAKQVGAHVTLISGPTYLTPPSGIQCERVRTADDMLKAVIDHIKLCDIFISVAAVCDFKPAQLSSEKIKKLDKTDWHLSLTPTPDILGYVTHLKTRPNYVVGFAAETQQLQDNALKKLHAKKLDLIIANDVSKKNQGFGADKNAVQLFWENGKKTQRLELKEKWLLAREIVGFIAGHYNSGKQLGGEAA